MMMIMATESAKSDLQPFVNNFCRELGASMKFPMGATKIRCFMGIHLGRNLRLQGVFQPPTSRKK